MLNTCPVFELTKPQVGMHESPKPEVGKLVPLKNICKGLRTYFHRDAHGYAGNVYFQQVDRQDGAYL